MGEPLKVGNKDKRYPKIADKKVYDQALDDAGIGAQHKAGLSSQNGRTTIIYRNGARIVVRADGKLLLPEEVKPLRRMGMSMFNLLEKNDAISYV